MSNMKSEIRCRYATVEDREAVLDIIPNLYYGNDVLVSTYLDNIKDPTKLMFLGEHQGKVVAFVQYNLVDDGKNVIGESGRVTPRLQHKGVVSALRKFAFPEIRKQFPEVQNVRSANADAEATYSVVDKHGAKILARRDALFCAVEARPLKDFFASDKFHQLYRMLGCYSSLVQTPESACRILQDSPNKNVFPDDLLFCWWVPYMPLPSNYREITKKSTTVTTQDPRTGELLAVSFATDQIVKVGRGIFLGIHTRCDPVPISLIKNHIVKQLLLLNQYFIKSRSEDQRCVSTANKHRCKSHIFLPFE